jgi:hypothetical protein
MSDHKNIAEALVAFQSEMPVVPKNKTAKMGTYSYKYADLVDVSAAMHPLLTKHGLAFSCLPRQAEGGGYELAGTLLHTSGDRLEGALPLYGRTAQEIGSALTYARRYLAGCLTGICTDDDEDGQATTKATRTKAEPTANKDWGVIADTAEMMTQVGDVKHLWTQEGVAKAPKAVQERIKAHVASLKAEDGA